MFVAPRPRRPVRQFRPDPGAQDRKRGGGSGKTVPVHRAGCVQVRRVPGYGCRTGQTGTGPGVQGGTPFRSGWLRVPVQDSYQGGSGGGTTGPDSRRAAHTGPAPGLQTPGRCHAARIARAAVGSGFGGPNRSNRRCLAGSSPNWDRINLGLRGGWKGGVRPCSEGCRGMLVRVGGTRDCPAGPSVGRESPSMWIFGGWSSAVGCGFGGRVGVGEGRPRHFLLQGPGTPVWPVRACAADEDGQTMPQGPGCRPPREWARGWFRLVPPACRDTHPLGSSGMGRADGRAGVLNLRGRS